MTDTGRRVGPSPARDPISGELKTLEQERRARNPVVVARAEGWEVGRFLGLVKFTKGDRLIVDVDFYGKSQICLGGCVFSDSSEVNVTSSPSQVLAALRGVKCSCSSNEGGYNEKHSAFHEETCELSAA